MKNRKQWINWFCPAPIGRVRYYYRTCPVWPGTETKCSVLVIPDVSGIQPDVSGVAWTRTLIVLQLSIWSIHSHISLTYSKACDLLNLSGLWASPEVNFKYGNFIRFMVKMKIGSPCLNRIKMFVESCLNYLKHLFRGS